MEQDFHGAAFVGRKPAEYQGLCAAVVLRHQMMLRRLLARFCRRESYLVDDLVQETFLRAFKHMQSFRQEAQLSTWLYRIGLNVARDYCRRNKITWVALTDAQLADESLGQSEPAGARCELELSELRGDLTRALGCISQAQQRAIQLCVAEGYSHSCAAAIMEIPLGTLKTHVARGKLQLQQQLAHWQV
jgi:RNA polymerase sigma factor (sigma-70 family)